MYLNILSHIFIYHSKIFILTLKKNLYTKISKIPFFTITQSIYIYFACLGVSLYPLKVKTLKILKIDEIFYKIRDILFVFVLQLQREGVHN